MNTYAPTLPPDVEEAQPRRLSDLWNQMVEAHSTRDADMIEGYEQLMRISATSPNRPNRMSCDLIDPIVFKHHVATLASVDAAHSQRPFWLVEATEPGSEDGAARIERGLDDRAYRDGFRKALYDADWITLRDQAALMFVGWGPKTRMERSLRYRPVDDPDAPAVEENERQAEVEYEEEPWGVPVTVRNGYEFEVYDRADTYFNPPEANDIDDFDQIGVRRYYTAGKLLEGIRKYGFDEDVVRELIGMGATGYGVRGDYIETKREVSGTNPKPAMQNEGIACWEIAFLWGKFPVWLDQDGEFEIPEHLQDDEFFWILCPYHQKLLRFTYSPFHMRPFALFRMLREPNGQGGESVPTMTGAYQDEGTALLRMSIDSANLQARPTMKVLAANDERFGTQVLDVGGKILCERSLNEIDVMRWDHTNTHESMLWMQDVRSRADSVMGAIGFGELQQKVRKNRETESAMAAVSSKLNLFVSNIQSTGMERVAMVMLSHWSQFGGDDPYTVMQRGAKPIEVQPEDVKKVYQIKPRGTAADADPTVRAAKRQQLVEVLRSSPLYRMKVAGGDLRPEYQLMRELGNAIDEHFSIESYFGEEPPPPEQAQQVAQMMGQIFGQLTGHPKAAGQAAQMFMQNPQGLATLWALLQAQPQGKGGAAPGRNGADQASPAFSMNGAGQ